MPLAANSDVWAARWNEQPHQQFDHAPKTVSVPLKLPIFSTIVNNGDLSGAGTITLCSGALSGSGGLVKTGASTTFQLSGSNSFTGVTTGFEITSPLFTAGTFDLVNGDGGVIFGGILSLAFGNGPYADGTDVLQLFANTGSRSGDVLSVVATGLGDGQSVTFNPSTGTISVVPEPSSCVMALAGLADGCRSMWRRKRA
jgi:hypothetical protein